MRDNDTKTIMVRADGNKLSLVKNAGYMPSRLGVARLIGVGRQAVRQKFLGFNNMNSVTF